MKDKIIQLLMSDTETGLTIMSGLKEFDHVWLELHKLLSIIYESDESDTINKVAIIDELLSGEIVLTRNIPTDEIVNIPPIVFTCGCVKEIYISNMNVVFPETVLGHFIERFTFIFDIFNTNSLSTPEWFYKMPINDMTIRGVNWTFDNRIWDIEYLENISLCEDCSISKPVNPMEDIGQFEVSKHTVDDWKLGRKVDAKLQDIFPNANIYTY